MQSLIRKLLDEDGDGLSSIDTDLFSYLDSEE
jgi:hypothetical protein